MADIIKVDRTSIKKYGELAVEQFAKINARLQNLVADMTTVHYYGSNAYEFKTKGGDMAVQYAEALNKDMRAISEAVQGATTAISKSMGGQVVTLPAPSGSGVTRPAVQKGDGTEEVNPDALTELTQSVTKWFTAIDNLLDAHLKHLQGTVWEGKAKNQAVTAVRKFTKNAKDTSDEAQKSITTYIREQVDAARSADNSLG
jgi:hypothetical protein